MDEQRWKDLTFGNATQLTPEEQAQGWHWCCEWDDMMVGPEMHESMACSCTWEDPKITALYDASRPRLRMEHETHNHNSTRKELSEGNPAFVPMPPTLNLRNGTYERCDMAVGPCCCGATHALRHWNIPVVTEINRYYDAPYASEFEVLAIGGNGQSS